MRDQRSVGCAVYSCVINLMVWAAAPGVKSMAVDGEKGTVGIFGKITDRE